MKLGEAATNIWALKAVFYGAAVVIALTVITGWIGRPLGPLKRAGSNAQCQSNLHVLLRAVAMYADDYQDRLPPATLWMDRIDFFLDDRQKRDQVYCPEVRQPGGTEYGYAMNRELSSKARSFVQVYEIKPLLLEVTDYSRSAVSFGLKMPKPGRHIASTKTGKNVQRGNYVGLAGGGVRFSPD